MKKIKRYRTDHLFVRSNFIIGMGSVLNIAGNYFRFKYSDSDLEADHKAIKSDWQVIGDDIAGAMNRSSENH